MRNNMYTNEQLQRQLAIEEEGRQFGVSRYRRELLPWDEQGRQKSSTGLSELPPGQELINKLIPGVAAAIQELRDKAKDTGAKRGGAWKLIAYADMIKEFDNDFLAWLTVVHMINSLSTRTNLVVLAKGISSNLLSELNYTHFKEQDKGNYENTMHWLRKTSHAGYRKRVLDLAMYTHNVQKIVWDSTDAIRLGQTLVNCVVETAPDYFELVMVQSGKRRNTILTASEELNKWLEKRHSQCELMRPLTLPMVVKPLPWVGATSGGYLAFDGAPLRLIRTQNNAYLREIDALARAGGLTEVIDAVNSVQETAWKINGPVLEVLKRVWSTGGEKAGLPPSSNRELPNRPWEQAGVDSKTWIAAHPEEFKAWKGQAAGVHVENTRDTGKRLTVLQQIWIGEKFLNEEAIYFPHTLDFRGRLYPVPSLVNPQANDVGKSLLQFSEGKPLGEYGGYWLAVHIANLFGHDKIPLDDRVAWTQENSLALELVAADPMQSRFWLDADKPWQALAACFEWAGFMAEGDSFVSHLPVAMDGSCSGLQHYSAMLRDPIGGKATNVTPSELPQDIYMQVAELVQERVDKDAAKGVEYADLWVGNVNRAMAKRPVMTYSYGSTRTGMRGQIMEVLRSAAGKGDPLIDDKHVWGASSYLAGLIYKSIGDVVVAAAEAMDWLKETAKVAAKENLPINWTSPAGLPVQQVYRKFNNKRLNFQVKGIRVRLSIGEADESKLDARRQTQGIAPNFIHSCDAAHLMKTINLCTGAGLNSFAMIHDSFGVHAADTETMNQELRVAFVQQYRGDVITDFFEEIKQQLPPEVWDDLPEPPTLGTMDLDSVMRSDFFFA